MLKYALAATVLMLAVSCEPVHRTAVIYPSDDSFVWEFFHWKNYGSLDRASVGELSWDANIWWAWWHRRVNEAHRRMWTALKFDLTPYSSAVIDSAKVALYIYDTRNTFPPDEVWIARCTDDWDEDEITWDNKPGYDQSDWRVPSAPVYAWWTIDVTAMVRDWVFGTHPNYGFWIGANTDGRDFFHIYTKETAGTIANPQLILYYTEYTSDSSQ